MREETMLPLKIHLCGHLQRLGMKAYLSPALILPGFYVSLRCHVVTLNVK
jgi:hypothetical protein